MKKALCVGINYYEGGGSLPACTDDAKAISHLLSHNYDESENFEVTELLAYDKDSSCTSSKLFSAVRKLFDQEADTVLFYYSGHGGIYQGNGYLCPSDATYVPDCLAMETLLDIISQSKATNKIIILDSCHSGSLGRLDVLPGCDVLPENTTILAASRANETSGMNLYGSFFTMALYEALYGGAANILGEITPASVYAFIDRALQNHEQRPVFKANLDHFVILRKHKPDIDLEDLRKITGIFYMPEYDYPLDPSYEEDKRDVKDEKFQVHNEKNEAIFALLRKYAALNLVVPVDAPHMYQAAVYSKSCRLTPSGVFYWKLLKGGII